MEPKIMFYADKARTKPIEELDFGIVDVGDEKKLTVFVYNYGEGTLRKIKVEGLPDGVKVVEQPSELQSGETGKMVFSWTPRDKNLEIDFEVIGMHNGT